MAELHLRSREANAKTTVFNRALRTRTNVCFLSLGTSSHPVISERNDYRSMIHSGYAPSVVFVLLMKVLAYALGCCQMRRDTPPN
jgi:hypothetical protein